MTVAPLVKTQALYYIEDRGGRLTLLMGLAKPKEMCHMSKIKMNKLSMNKLNKIININTVKKFSLLAMATVLTACATATPYQPASQSLRNGFSETQIEKDRIKVTFDGNSLTDRETVETYLLYRAAELTKQKGYDYFTVVDRATDKKTRLVDTGFSDPYYGFFNYSYFHPRYGWSTPYYRPWYDPYYRSRWLFGGSRFGRSGFYSPMYDSWGRDFDFREITKYRASAEIKMKHGTKPAGKDNAFNASEVLENLRDKIVYPEDKK